MIRSIKQLDQSLSESKTKMKSDVERSLRGLNFGKLYFQNRDYETALKYVNDYLSVRPDSSDGYKLLAQINEAVGDNETAIINYRKSLDLKKQNNGNYSFGTPSKNQSFSSSMISSITTSSPLFNNSHTIDNRSNNTTIVDNDGKEMASQTVSQSGSHSCGTCRNEGLLSKMAKQQENLIETNKIILDIIKQNNSNISDIQQQLIIINESLKSLTDSQNVMQETLYDYVTQDPEVFEDYVSDDKENDTFDVSDLLNTSESQSNQWHSSTLQTDPQLDQKKPLSELFKPPTDSWQCEACYVQNNMSESSCIACQSPNPNITLPTPQQTDQGFKLANVEPFSFKPAFTSSSIGFNFGGINANNSVFSGNSFKFGNSVINNPLPSFNLNNFSQSNQILDQSSQNKFSINSKTDNTDKNVETTDKSVSFQFGLSRKFDFKFPDIPPEDNLKSPKSPSGVNVSLEVEDENSSATEHPEPSNADNIYFQPVVPLPPKVEVKTGEETEDILYSCRAKLFRFASNEWKERGVGELKILLCPNSGKVRLLMRRDTVLKVCLNQYITPELKLDLKEDKKSITWSAIDYSEDAPTPELFLLRLKNPESAGLFLEAFKSAQLLVKGTPVEVKSQESPSKPSKDNSDDIEIVYMKTPDSEEHLKKVTQLKLPLNFYDYEKMPPCPGCRGCSDEVPALKPIRQPSNDESLTNKSQDSVQENLFSSVIAANKLNQTNWQTNNASKPLWLVNTPSPIFSSENTELNADEDGVVANPDIYFKPVIPLPELVEVKTGEEDEEPIYCQRAKLYRYDPTIKEWKERGIGDFKILKHKHKCRYRMILRRDQILKIACNHYINSSMTLNPMNTSETAICWYAVDFSDGNPVEEQFALKFKNKELLQEFKKVFTQCKNDLENNENSFSLNHSEDNEEQNDVEGDEDTEEDPEQDGSEN